MSEIKLISSDVYKHFWRFSDLYDLYIKKDGRRQLFLDNANYVDDVDLFITGCLSDLPLTITLDGSTVNWRVLNSPEKIMTMIHFYENRITCQGLLFKEMEGYHRSWFGAKLIETFIITPAPDDYEKLKSFLKI